MRGGQHVAIHRGMRVLAGFMLARPKDPQALLETARLAQRDELLEQLAALEAQHAAGDVGPEFYARERASLRDAIAAWIKAAGDTQAANAHSSPR